MLDFKGGGADALGQVVEVPVDSMAEASQVIKEAMWIRSTRATSMNASSSRSRSLLFAQVRAASACLMDPPVLRLALVDLAGSERIAGIESSQATLEESRNINLALSVLSTMIQALQRSRRTYHSALAP